MTLFAPTARATVTTDATANPGARVRRRSETRTGFIIVSVVKKFFQFSTRQRNDVDDTSCGSDSAARGIASRGGGAGNAGDRRVHGHQWKNDDESGDDRGDSPGRAVAFFGQCKERAQPRF